MDTLKKIPVIKSGETIDITLTTQEVSAIVQAIFLISENWTQDDVDNLKTTLEKKEALKDPKQITFILLDRVYRRVLQKAISENKVEETDLTVQSPIL